MAVFQDRLAEQKTPFEIALDQALAERARLDKEDLPQARERVSALVLKREQLSRVIESIFNALPPVKQELYVRRPQQGETIELSNGRSGPIFNNVITLFVTTPQKDWSAVTLQQALAKKGIEAEPKQIHNILNYLEREGKLKRVGRGQYLFMGTGIESFEEETVKHPWFRNCDD